MGGHTVDYGHGDEKNQYQVQDTGQEYRNGRPKTRLGGGLGGWRERGSAGKKEEKEKESRRVY